MQQVARNLTDYADGVLRNARYLIMDRDPLFSKAFRAVLKASDLSAVRLPARSPNLNAFAERFVRSIKSECLHRIVPLGERHLRTVVREYVEHYHLERNHQGLENQLLTEPSQNAVPIARIRKRERLGGTLNFYFREAA
jgi:putative transposase